MRDETYTPFEGERTARPAAMRVLHRFTKEHHVAEIREPCVTAFRAIEFIVFIDEQLHESQMFHGTRAVEYLPELVARIAQFTGNVWVEDPSARSGSMFGNIQ